MVGRPFEVPIPDSLEYLEQSVRQARTASQKERLLMLVWLKTKAVTSRDELAARCHRDKATITRWIRRYKDGGLAALLTVGKAPGATPKIQGEALEHLKARLEKPEEGFHSYGEIQQWLNDECGLEVKYGTVYRVVRYQLKAKLKVPRPRSTDQAPEAMERFKKKLH